MEEETHTDLTTLTETTQVVHPITEDPNHLLTDKVTILTDTKVTQHGVLVVTDRSIVTVVPLVARVLLWCMNTTAILLRQILLTARRVAILLLLLKRLREEILVHLMVYTGLHLMVVAPDKSIV